MATAYKIEQFATLSIDMLYCTSPAAGFYTITPSFAKAVLETRNTNNRKPSGAKIAQSCSDIENGRFLINGESIIFDQTGTLIDGQHRLHAVVQTGIAIVSLCAFGIAPEASKTIDQGKVRTAGDIVSIRGFPDGNNLSAMARMLIAYRDGDGSTLGRPSEISTGSVIQFIENNPVLLDVNLWTGRFGKALQGVCSRTALGAARVLLEERYGPRVVEYLERIGSGENIAQGDPAFAVRRRLWGTRVTNAVAMEAIFRGAIAFMDNRQLSRIEIHNRFPALT